MDGSTSTRGQSTRRARRWIDGERDGAKARYQCLHRRACSHTPCVPDPTPTPNHVSPTHSQPHPQNTSAAAVDDALTAHAGALRRPPVYRHMPLTKKQNLARARHHTPLLAAARALQEHAIVRHLPVQRHIPLANALSLGQIKPCRLHSRPQTHTDMAYRGRTCTSNLAPPQVLLPTPPPLAPPPPPTCCPLFLFLHTTAIHLYSCARVYRHMQCMYTSKCSLLLLLPLSLLSRSRARALSLTHAHQHTHDLNNTQP